MYSKQSQLSKNRKPNPKKMSDSEYKKKCDWLFETYPICQVCNNSKAVDPHHAISGRDKDDRTIIALCRECHHAIHHSRLNLVERFGYIAMRHNLEKLGLKNHKEWESEIQK